MAEIERCPYCEHKVIAHDDDERGCAVGVKSPWGTAPCLCRLSQSKVRETLEVMADDD